MWSFLFRPHIYKSKPFFKLWGLSLARYRLGIVVISKHVVLNWKHFNLSIKTRKDNDLIVSENFLNEVACNFAGELAVA